MEKKLYHFEKEGMASKAGKRAHKLGRAHQWTEKEARELGKKGGLTRWIKYREALKVKQSK